MNVRLATLAAVTLVACGAPSYAWRPEKGPLDEKRLRADIDACEEHRKQTEMGGSAPTGGGARAHGGWGDATFEFCMRKRGWKLDRVGPGTAGPEESQPQAAQPSAVPPAPVELRAVPAASGAPASAGGSAEAARMPIGACPVAVPGTRLTVADTQDGEAITFTTYPERIEELRSRAHAMADMHNRRHSGGAEGAAGGSDATAAAPPQSRAAVEDVDGGARLLVKPNDPADLDRVRAAVRKHAEHMRDTGTCEGHHGGR